MTNDEINVEDFPKYDLLARHLAPRFGSIYRYNLDGGYPGEDPQPWTDEIKESIRNYLLHELPSDVAVGLFGASLVRLNDRKAAKAVDAALARSEPWEIALEVQEAAVKAVPSLDQLIGHLDTWPSENERWDTMTWLEAHATADEVHSTVSKAGLQSKGGRLHPGIQELTHGLEPPTLRMLWYDTHESELSELTDRPDWSDLTDVEWELVKPFVMGRSAEDLPSIRRAFDGMMYRSINGVPWADTPARYGTVVAICDRYSRYRLDGVFRRMLRELNDKPDAARIEREQTSSGPQLT